MQPFAAQCCTCGFLPVPIWSRIPTAVPCGQIRPTLTSYTSDPIDYAPYGQGKAGTLTVKLEKKVNDEAKADAPSTHETEKVQNPAETYTLTIEYVPLTAEEKKEQLISAGRVSADDPGYMHNGSAGPGKEVTVESDEVKSVNTHKICLT